MMSMMEQMAHKVEALESKQKEDDAGSSISLSPSEQTVNVAQVTTTQLEESKDRGMYQVKGKLGGDSQLRAFLLDTAANCNVMPLSLCQRLGLVI